MLSILLSLTCIATGILMNMFYAGFKNLIIEYIHDWPRNFIWRKHCGSTNSVHASIKFPLYLPSLLKNN